MTAVLLTRELIVLQWVVLLHTHLTQISHSILIYSLKALQCHLTEPKHKQASCICFKDE